MSDVINLDEVFNLEDVKALEAANKRIAELESKIAAQGQIIFKYECLIVKMKGYGYGGFFPVEETIDEVKALKKKAGWNCVD